MEEDLILDAKLSKGAYNQTAEIDGWKRDDQLSNFNRSIYTKDGKARVAFRGTDLKNSKTRWDDLGTDALVGLGLQDLSSRMKNAKRTADLATKKYGKDNVSLTGHSLGGSQSAFVSRATGLKGTGFNSGFSPVDTLRKRTYSNFTNLTADGDLISSFGRKLKRMSQLKVNKRGHGISRFL